MKAFLKKHIPIETRLIWLKKWDDLRHPLLISYLKIVSGNRFFCGLHYAFVSAEFSREHRGVLRGRLHYLEQESNGQPNLWLLRRNTHRLEKGLIMQPRRSVFAADYIEETVDAFERMRTAGTDDVSFRWSENVLSEYFHVTGSHPRIDAARQRFQARVAPASGTSIPYKREHREAPVAFDDFLKLSHLRRSVRWYLDQPVPRELIDQAITAARQSPSACNRQPFSFRIFTDPEMVPKVAALPGGTTGFDHQFPCMIVIVGHLNAYYLERDRHLIYIDSSLAAMSFMLALETLGLSSCPINWPDVKKAETAMASLLHLPPDDRAIMCLSVGYASPEGMIPFSEKKSLDELRIFNQL